MSKRTSDGFLSLFESRRPILAMLHLSGETPDDVFRIALEEIDVLVDGGVDAVIVENYFGAVEDVERVLDHLQRNRADVIYGLNVLKHDEKAFELANRYGASFVQLDSVVGHVPPEQEEAFGARLATLRDGSDAYVLGGVRFKYQPVLSAFPVAHDLAVARDRCDGVVVTGDGTGIETSIEKIREFREGLGDFPLFVGAGLTTRNVRAQLAEVDGAVVGSFFKDTYEDTGRVDPDHVEELMTAVRDAIDHLEAEPTDA